MSQLTMIGLIMIGGSLPLFAGIVLLHIYKTKKEMNRLIEQGACSDATAKIIEIKRTFHRDSSMIAKKRTRGHYTWDVTEEVNFTAGRTPVMIHLTRYDGLPSDKVGDTRNFELYYEPENPQYNTLLLKYDQLTIENQPKWIDIVSVVFGIGFAVCLVGGIVLCIIGAGGSGKPPKWSE